MHFAKLHWPRSFSARLVLVYLVSMLVSAGLVGIVVMLLAEPFNRYMLQHVAIDRAEQIAERVQFDSDGKPAGFDPAMIQPWILSSLKDEVVARIVDSRGYVHFASDKASAPLMPNGKFEASNMGFKLVHQGVAMHGATVRVEHQGASWFVQFATSDRIVMLLQQSIGRPAMYQAIIATCVTFLAIFLIMVHLTLQRVLRPLRMASLKAQRITPQSLSDRLEMSDLPSELVPLIDAFNRALDRLQLGFQTQQEFLANAAHELKTPLALIRAQAEIAVPRGCSPHILQDIDLMARQVQQLLVLAEASEQRNYRMETYDPRSVMLEACDFMDRVAQGSNVQIALVFEENLSPWTADRGAVFTLVKNLLENAIQHSPPGGTVQLRVGARGFVVADQGPGVAHDHLGRLFERFWRGAARRDKGAGLGLSICKEIVAAHAWHIEVHQPETGGLEMHVVHSS